MWELSVGIYLLVGSMLDLVKREIPISYLVSGTVFVMMHQVFESSGAWLISGLGALIGVVFLNISKYTEEKIGYGDSWMILNLGVYLGIWKIIVLLIAAFGASFLFSCVGLWCKKLKRDTRLPFFPFLMIGYIGAMIW